MNETMLIALGVSVFAMTIVAVLIYFYSLFDRLAADGSTGGVVTIDASDTDI